MTRLPIATRGEIRSAVFNSALAKSCQESSENIFFHQSKPSVLFFVPLSTSCISSLSSSMVVKGGLLLWLQLKGS